MEIPEFLMDMLKNQYSKEIVENIIKGYQNKRVVTFRVNTLKTDIDNIKKRLDKENIEYEDVFFSDTAVVIKNCNERRLQQLDMYTNGEIYLQSLSSMLPPIILNPQEGKDILDMAAAPGGKTTQIAALTSNKAHITACEINNIRMERLKYNIAKQGATCVFIMKKDSRQIEDFFSFDQILLDAPCSGSGTLNISDNNLEKTFTKKLIDKSTKTQIQLLRKAINILKPGNEMVYSTCSILECENEAIINKVLNEKNVEIVPIEIKGMEKLPLLPTKIKGTLCVCPNDYYEGFFIAKIKVTS